MDKKPIRLTEQDLHFLVENAVQAYLTENGMGEDVRSGIKGVWNRFNNKRNRTGVYADNQSDMQAQPQGNFFNRMGQRINNFGNSVTNAKRTYQANSANGDAQKAITNAINALNALMDADRRMKQVGGAGLMGNAATAVKNAYQALTYSKNNAGNIRNQFQGSADVTSKGGQLSNW
jgi:hypothetical protein